MTFQNLLTRPEPSQFDPLGLNDERITDERAAYAEIGATLAYIRAAARETERLLAEAEEARDEAKRYAEEAANQEEAATDGAARVEEIISAIRGAIN